jgi:hypothetical protein
MKKDGLLGLVSPCGRNMHGQANERPVRRRPVFVKLAVDGDRKLYRQVSSDVPGLVMHGRRETCSPAWLRRTALLRAAHSEVSNMTTNKPASNARGRLARRPLKPTVYPDRVDPIGVVPCLEGERPADLEELEQLAFYELYAPLFALWRGQAWREAVSGEGDLMSPKWEKCSLNCERLADDVEARCKQLDARRARADRTATKAPRRTPCVVVVQAESRPRGQV